MITPDEIRLSPNVNPHPLVPSRTVIIHCTRSGVSMNPSEYIGTLNYMARPGTTSSHWVISRTGKAARVVYDDRQAWHAQEDNDNCWGIEIEQGAEQDGFTDVQLDKLIEVCKGYVQDFGVPPIRAQSSTQPGFIGHQDTAQGRRNGKSDPGRYFQWDTFIQRLQGPLQPPEEPGEDDMIRHNAIHQDNQFKDRHIPGTGVLLNDVRSDFNLPSDARRVRLELYLKSGDVRVHDGNAGNYAGRVGWGGPAAAQAAYGTIDAELIGNAITLYGPGDFALLGCVGYWR